MSAIVEPEPCSATIRISVPFSQTTVRRERGVRHEPVRGGARPGQAGRRTAQPADAAGRRGRGVRHLRRRRADPGDRGRAGVGIGTIYRHFPTRADLVVAVYRHQVEACAEAGSALLASAASPFAALRQWVDLFVDFLVTKHGLAKALQSDSGGFETLHAWFLDRLVPVCAHLLDAAVDAGEITPGTHAYELMRGIGNLCIGRDSDPRYDPRRLVNLLLAGLQRPQSS